MSIAGHAAHIATMANQLVQQTASCTPYLPAQAAALPEPPELGYRLFSPEFLDELEEYHQAMAVSRFSA